MNSSAAIFCSNLYMQPVYTSDGAIAPVIFYYSYL